MRLIDADELKRQVKRLPMMSNWGEAFITQIIDEQPIIDPSMPLAGAIAEKDESLEDNMDKPRICEVLGVEVNQNFQFNDFPFDDVKSYFIGTDGEIRNVHGGEVASSELCYIINHPDCIIRKPRWTEQEVERAKAVRALWNGVDKLEKCNLHIKAVDGTHLVATMSVDLFPSLRPGETVKLDEIIGGAE